MIVGTSWVFLYSFLHTILAWQGAPVSKKCEKKSRWAAPLFYYGPYGKKEIGWCLITGSLPLKEQNLTS